MKHKTTNSTIIINGSNNVISQGFDTAEGIIAVFKGKKIPMPKGCSANNIRISVNNGKMFVNGYEWFPDQDCWKRTFTALWYDIFG